MISRFRRTGGRRAAHGTGQLRAAFAVGLVLSFSGLLTILASSPAAARPAVATPDATPTPRTMTVSVYFARDDKIGAAHRTIPIPDDKRVAAAAMRELLAGPTELEQKAGLTTSIPEGTELLGVELDAASKVATVNLSRAYESGGGTLSMAMRLAQVVFTLTQFPTIEQVIFELEGERVTVFSSEGLILDHPVGREDYEELTPLIFVESPAPGDTVTSPLRIWGTANTFEATFMVDVLDADGTTLVSQFVTATSGSGVRGTFDASIPFELVEPGPGTVVVYEISAKDGTRVNEVRIPVELALTSEERQRSQ